MKTIMFTTTKIRLYKSEKKYILLSRKSKVTRKMSFIICVKGKFKWSEWIGNQRSEIIKKITMKIISIIIILLESPGWAHEIIHHLR